MGLKADDGHRMRTLLISIVMLASLLAASSLHAGPPSYLLLRQPESPGPHHYAGEPAAKYYDVRTEGYAYGYFGACPRSHWSRSYGVLRIHKQWSQW
jgi:hypothetical protein